MRSSACCTVLLATLMVLATSCGGGGGGSTPAPVIPPSGLTYGVNPAVYTRSLAISPNIPAVAGGAATSWTVAPALPVGLALDPGTGFLSGTPATVSAARAYAVTAGNAGGSTSANLTLTVNDLPPTTLTYASNPALYTRGQAIPPNPPASSGGAVTAYAIHPPLPAGLILDTGTGVIAGTPAEVAAGAAFTVTASNTGGNAVCALTITVQDAPPASLRYTTMAAVYVKGTAIAPNLPSSTGGTPTSYQVSPPLPAGLALDPATGAITGTPSAVVAASVYTVTAADPAGSSTLGLSIAVNDAPPSGLAYQASHSVYVKGTPIIPNAPSHSGGAAGSYQVNPALPAGLNLDPATGLISGTPKVVAAAALYTVTATGSTGSTSVALSIAVNDLPPSGLSYPNLSSVYRRGVAIAPNAPSVSGGAVTSYLVSPALPAGLNLDPATGVISGTPSAPAAQAGYSVTAGNSGGTTAEVLTITVLDLAPAGLAYVTNPANYTRGLAIPANAPSSAGGAVVAYAVAPPLPAGLALDGATGVLTGTPAGLAPATVYAVTASNSGGSTAVDLTLGVHDPAPAGLSYTYASATFTVGTAIPQDRPTLTGGVPTLYTVSPDLPSGLGLDPVSGAITGTPKAVAVQASYRITAGNTGGSATADLVFQVAPQGPQITSINWPSAAVGVRVRFAGSGFTGVTGASFNGTPAAFTVDSPAQISATVPAGASSGPVSVTSPQGAVSGPAFTVTTGPAPVLASVAPNPNTDYYAVLLQGSNILSGSRVSVGSSVITENFQSWADLSGQWLYFNGQVVAAGKVRIEGPNGTALSGTDLTFNVPPPAVASILPASAQVGSAITLNGSNLNFILTVDFNGVQTAPATRSATQLSVFVPLGAVSGPVTVSNASGSATGPAFTVLPAAAPVLAGLLPALGQPGNLVNLSGSGFLGASAVTFNGLPAAFSVLSPLQIQATVPQGASTGPVVVTTPSGSGQGPEFEVVDDAMLPRINQVNPASGATWATVYLTGVNLLGVSSVDFAGLGAYSWSVLSDTQIMAMVPWRVGSDVTGPIFVTTPNGIITSPGNFTVKAFPLPFDTQVTSIVPGHGVPWATVRVNGTGLDKVTSIYFSGGFAMSKAAFTVVDPTALDVVLPGRLKTGFVRFYTPDSYWGYTDYATSFIADPLVQGPPVIDSFSPGGSTRNWTLITVKGRNFTGTTSVGIGGSGPGDFFYVPDDNTVQIQTPMWSGTGPVIITTPIGTATSATDFVGPHLPAIYNLSPNNRAREGDVYRLLMSAGDPVQSISFGGVPASQWSIVDPFRIDVTLPAGARSGSLSFTTQAATAWSADTFFVDPTLTGMNPPTGTVGTTVTVSGRNFQDVTSVTFAGVPAGIFRIVSSGLIQAVVPAGAATGPIAFVNRAGGTGSTATPFTVVVPANGPVVADLSPDAAAPGSSILLSGSRLAGVTGVAIGPVLCNFTALSDQAILVEIPAGVAPGPVQVTTPAGSAASFQAFTPLAEPSVDLLANGDFEAGPVNWSAGYGSGALIRNALALPCYDLLAESGTWTQTVGGWGWQALLQNETRTVDAPTSDAIALPADASRIELRFLVGMKTEENTGVAKDFFNVKLMDPATGALLPGGLVFQLDNLTGPDHALAPFLVDLSAFKGQNVALRMESDEDKELGTSWTMDRVQVLAFGPASLRPVAADVFPASGYPGETLVTLNGTGLAGIQRILFNGVPTASWAQLDAQTLQTHVPFGASTGPIQLVTGAGAIVLPGSFTVNYHAPEAGLVEPTRGPVGTPIAIIGKHLLGATGVAMAGIPAAFRVDSDAQITTVIPVGATSGPLTVTGPGGTCPTPAFTVLASGITQDLYIQRVEFIQVTQREDSGVPLVKDRQAMARVHVRANLANSLLPTVALGLYQGQALVYSVTIPAPAGLTGAPLGTTEADFDKTWNALIPAQYLQPGLAVLAQVNPTGALPEVDPSNNFWPYDGVPLALDVRDTQPFKLTFVPLAVVKDGVTYTGDVDPTNTGTWLNMFTRIWPLPDAVDTEVHAPFNSQHLPMPDYSDWDPVLTELQVLRAAEGVHDRYYYGAYNAWWAGILGGGSGMANFPPACVAMGIGHDYSLNPSNNIFRWREATTAHELGHTMSRHHTPGCGAADPDLDYPYADSKIGQWGYDLTGGMAMDPAIRHDIMVAFPQIENQLKG